MEPQTGSLPHPLVPTPHPHPALRPPSPIPHSQPPHLALAPPHPKQLVSVLIWLVFIEVKHSKLHTQAEVVHTFTDVLKLPAADMRPQSKKPQEQRQLQEHAVRHWPGGRQYCGLPSPAPQPAPPGPAQPCATGRALGPAPPLCPSCHHPTGGGGGGVSQFPPLIT